MKIKLSLILFLALIAIVGCSGSDTSSSEHDGGQEKTPSTEEVKIAYDTSPPSIDPHLSTAVATVEVSRPIFEGLIALDSEFKPQPMLAEYWEVSEDNKTITFKLREGVKFHNGKEMIAEDVIASMKRWVELSMLGRGNFADATFEAQDNYTIVVKMPEPNSVALTILGNPLQYAGIMPKEIIEGADSSGVKEYIGTGPYKVEEWVIDQYLLLAKNEDYQSVSTQTDGISGKKEAIAEKIRIDIVNDPSTRLSGLQTGQYDLAKGLPIDNVEMLKSDSNITTYNFDFGFDTMILNKKEGVFSNQKARQAALAALDMDAINKAAVGSEEFYSLEHSLASKDQVEWYSDAGKENYNQKNQEKAKALLKEAGYKGEEIILMTTRDYEHQFNEALAVQQQLEGIGMNVKVETYDWSTLLQVRLDPSVWDMYTTGWPTEALPFNYIFLNSKNEYPGWTNSEVLDDLIAQMKVSTSQEEQQKLFAEFQEEFYKYVPVIKYGDRKLLDASRSNVKGYNHSAGGAIFWSIYKEK